MVRVGVAVVHDVILGRNIRNQRGGTRDPDVVGVHPSDEGSTHTPAALLVTSLRVKFVTNTKQLILYPWLEIVTMGGQRLDRSGD